MATKPTIALARFADQIGANLVALTSGERDLGFGSNTLAASGKVNTELNELYKWALYLNDGIFTGGVTFDSLQVGGISITFGSHTFTANSGTDELTVTAHGLSTGDGVMNTSNSGGALPSPLIAATPYFAIVTGANTFKLATSRSNALSGVAIDLTTNGTGTNSIVGVSPTRTGNGTVIGDLDATRLLPLVNAAYPLAATDWRLESGAAAYAAGKWTATAAARLVVPLRLPVGAILTKARFSYNLGAGGNSVLLGAGSIDIATGTVTEVNLFTDPTSTTWTTQDVSLFATNSAGAFTGGAGSHVIRNDRLYWLSWDMTHVANTQSLGGVMINP